MGETESGDHVLTQQTVDSLSENLNARGGITRAFRFSESESLELWNLDVDQRGSVKCLRASQVVLSFVFV